MVDREGAENFLHVPGDFGPEDGLSRVTSAWEWSGSEEEPATRVENHASLSHRASLRSERRRRGWNVDFVYKGTTRELSARDNPQQCSRSLPAMSSAASASRRKGANVVGVHLSREAEAPTRSAAGSGPVVIHLAHKRTRPRPELRSRRGLPGMPVGSLSALRVPHGDSEAQLRLPPRRGA